MAFLKKIKARFILAAIPILFSALITPYCIKAAYIERGYEAFGGEYLVIPIGIIISVAILTAAGDRDRKNRLTKCDH